MPALTDDEVMQALRGMQQWMYEGRTLSRRFRFKDFVDAVAFVVQAAALQHEMRHYGTVTQAGPIVMVDLRSDDEGGRVTERDLELARKLTAGAVNAL